MIKSLEICNYALLRNVRINFTNGFTVISGETGAGKSIILDALSLLLGKRVERSSENKDVPKSIIEGVFIIDNSRKSFFTENNLDFEIETIVRREIDQKGKSRAFINDTPVLLHVLTAFGKQVVEIHAQNQSVLLKDENAQFKLIDQLARSEKELDNYQQELKFHSTLETELSVIKRSGSLSVSELEFLQFQYDELDAANLRLNEKEELEQQIILLENIDGIASVITESEHYFNNENGILSCLSSIKRRLLEFDSFHDFSERVESMIIELNDISIGLSDVNNKLETDPEQLLKLSNRLDLLNNLLQKHRKNFIEELIDLKNEILAKITASESFEFQLIEKKKEINKQLKILKIASGRLNDKRVKVLLRLKQEVQQYLQNLGIPFAQFQVILSDAEAFHQFGDKKISFLFSANKGRDLQKIDKVVSGGELSRLMLAIKYVTVQSSNIHTLVFDEIDTGVSGRIASLMGEMMLKISEKNQLVAISHLPQIASKADTHLKVVKTINNSRTTSSVVVLNKQQRIEEIAKLLSGKKLTKAAFDNAVELLNQ
jgi:DNA repair protein RecN (Recombination protein N)